MEIRMNKSIERHVWRVGRVGIAATFLCLAVLTRATNVSAQSQSLATVAAAFKDPGQEWKDYPTRTLADLPAAVREKTDSDLDPYGGQLPAKFQATGFFHTTKRDDRWWLVDPTGSLCVYKGIASVTPLRASGAMAAFQSKFGNKSNWAAETTDLLRNNGFIGAGAWSDSDALRSVPRPLAYTRVLNFMSGYGRARGGTYSQPGHTGYPKGCIFVFDPAFESFCEEHARTLAESKNDPSLIGFFSDNELPFSPASLNNYLALPEKDPGHEAALTWLRARHGAEAGAQDIVAQDQSDFLAVVVDRYFRITSSAIKKHDPNHLFLGSRFYGSNLSQPEVFRAAGRWLDVISVNWYHAWTPDPGRLAMWERESGKPILITEWYAKGMDSGLANRSGAGWVVKTQRDRGLYYQNFTLGLLESKVCIGWDWFKYADNDPEDTGADPSNRDSNKGILNSRYEPYSPLLDAMKQINERTFTLIEYFDQKAKVRSPTN
jgi:hypothetical protein